MVGDDTTQAMLDLALSLGFSEACAMDPKELKFYPEVRAMCEQNRCGQYQKNWSCPPGCGDVAALEASAHQYKRGVLVQSVGTLSSSFDFETMTDVESAHKMRFIQFVAQAREICPDMRPMGSGSCTLCGTCSYPDAPCRFPDRQVVSMEAHGLAVFEVCEQCGTSLWHGENTIAYAACILF